MAARLRVLSLRVCYDITMKGGDLWVDTVVGWTELESPNESEKYIDQCHTIKQSNIPNF